MDRRQLLLISALTALAVISPMPAVADTHSCGPGSVLGGGCSGVAPSPSIGDGGVSIGGTVTLPGSGGGAGNSGPSTPGTGGEQADPDSPTPGRVCSAPVGGPRICRDNYTATGPLEGRGPVTLADLVNFAPTISGHRMQPDGWMVVGLDTNFYIDTGTQVQNDLLLGVPASVRFTPIAYRWNYGDGTSIRSSMPGASWAELGVGEFDPTPTSHVFRTEGTFAIDASVEFTAEYRFGQGAGAWIPIAGTVTIPAARLTATAQDATTVLVTGDCVKKPSAPGC